LKNIWIFLQLEMYSFVPSFPNTSSIGKYLLYRWTKFCGVTETQRRAPLSIQRIEVCTPSDQAPHNFL
jgi:hypothetical protein